MIKQQLLRGFKEHHGSLAEHKSKLCSVERAGITLGCVLQYCQRKAGDGALPVTVPGGFWMPALETPNQEQRSPFRESAKGW